MIGIFDSGVGGISVWKELYDLMPDQDFVYVADCAYCPYGRKSKNEIVERAKKILCHKKQPGNMSADGAKAHHKIEQ
jgi:glutamate racemase